ncbi:uncharacterized protein EV420DRAFT_1474454 [Desarmillaria tabescens]|uniref:Glutamine synthetase n=1 Tax=Armillaria tabescens TaxID=1929756 RepID=A0AA39NJY4_ARMTA|nr:uncharacterized protein EV420DRAFT_1474454 [Desarmillaria tabescens]KAK0467062.1 hypothetical protein EV420DRAFT_1474454 [Desarmillaria tabescens]
MSTDYSHGVQYSPATLAPTKIIKTDELEGLGITFIRLTWVDLTSVVRFRVIPLAHFFKMLQSPRPSVAIAKVTMGLVYLHTADEFSAIGEYLYVPDLSTLRLCPYEEGHASVLGWFQKKAPVLGADGNLTVAVDLCPRSVLQRVVKQSKETGVEFLVGFETEFILLKSTNPVEAANYHAWTASDGLPSGAVESRVMREIVESLLKSGIEVTMYHPEAAPGQYEVVTGPLLPLQAADALIHTRETIVNVAIKYGLRATFAPRVYMTSAGSAAHTHISVHSVVGGPKPSDSLSSLESSFLASVLKHLPAMAAITLPIPASYKRVADGVWSGGTYVCWGTENREAPIRLTNAVSPKSRNFELRFLDGTCNPYLALALILSAGLDGVINQEPLGIKDCPGPLTAAQMDEKERHELGINKRMPLTWDEARTAFQSDALVEKTFGKNMIVKYLSVNKTLGTVLEESDETEQARLTRLVQFY